MRNGNPPAQAAPRDMRHMFRESDSDFLASRRNMGFMGRDVWHPPTDVYETESDIVIKMCVPGVRPEQVTVAINGNTITVCGVRNGPDPGHVVTYHQMEIRNGYFERRISLHIPFDSSGARGCYEDGFIYVRVPKAQQMVRQVLTIKLTL
jgi:HSP20 family protein